MMIQSLMNLMVELRLSYIKTWQPSHFVGTMTEMQKLIHLPLNLVEGSRPARGSLLRDRLEAADWIQFLIPVLWVVSPVSVWTKSNSTKSNLDLVQILCNLFFEPNPIFWCPSNPKMRGTGLPVQLTSFPQETEPPRPESQTSYGPEPLVNVDMEAS